jgi:linoleoyl-CoA desaturase
VTEVITRQPTRQLVAASRNAARQTGLAEPGRSIETSDSPSTVATLWRTVAPTPVEIRRARRRLHAKAVAIAGLVAVSYWIVVVSDVALPGRLVGALVLVVGLVAVGTSIMHDANHGSFSRHRWVNRVVACTSDGLGASSWLWRVQHNSLHHGNTNVVGFDADVELYPFARLAPSQPWHAWYRGQHVYMWPLYGFLALKNLLVSDLVAVITGRMGAQPLRARRTIRTIAGITLGKLGHLTWAVVVPLCFNPWWAVLVFYLGCSWLVGFALAIVFQLAHCVDVTTMHDDDASRRGEDFAAHQLRTTADIASPVPILGHVFRWLVGGLDHQIEHHLAPRLPHTLYPQLAARFRSACREHDITYHRHPGVWSALRSHGRWLRSMSVPSRPSTASTNTAR